MAMQENIIKIHRGQRLDRNEFLRKLVDAHCRTNVTGIYAAGDVSTVPYKQIIISMGEGAKAALSAFDDRVRGII